MYTATSKDGTKIAYWRNGDGPPLLLVHGATADHTTTWRFVQDELARHFTVFTMDRRGRGESGDHVDHSLQREAEDVAAVIDAIGGKVNVVGHSLGANCAIEAALLTSNIDRLILYEGVPLRGADEIPAELPDKLDTMLNAGDLDGVLMALYRDLVGMSPKELEMMRSDSAAWDARRANARTIPREVRAKAKYTFEPKRFAELRVPTLLLVGADSPSRELTNAQAVAQALPKAQISIMPNQAHAAMYTDPALFVGEVLRFLRS